VGLSKKLVMAAEYLPHSESNRIGGLAQMEW
jgi:hypothetical protein